MKIIEPIQLEFSHETALTRKMLGRAPEAHFAWKPHTKSMTLGRLAGHIAEIPGWVSHILTTEEMVIDMDKYKPFEPATLSDLLKVFDANVASAAECMKGRSDAILNATWRLKVGDRVVFELPRVAVIRLMVLNHMIHHRGQLSVYLRLRDVPVPATYGPSADERE